VPARRGSQTVRAGGLTPTRGCYGAGMRIVGIFAAVVLSFAPLHAHADTAKAWTAAKAGLPAEAKIVIGVDFAALQKTQLFTALYAKLVEKAEVTKVLDTMKSTCKIDPLAAVQGVVIAQSADQQDGAIYLALAGVDRTKLSSCLQTAIQGMDDKTAKVSLKQDGNITQVITEGKDPQFFGWVGKDVVVVSPHAKDKAAILKWMTGKGALAKTDVGKFLSKVNTSAAVWGAAEATKELEPGITAKGGYGVVAFVKGNADADVHAVMGDATQAASMATAAKKQIDDAKGQLPPPLDALVKAVTIAAAKDEVILKGSFLEKDLLGAVALALGAS